MSASPVVVIIAGPNGAGKSTAAPRVLQGALGVTEFVNADEIARGLSGFNPEGAAIAAGRVMLSRLRELAERRISFAFETTLAKHVGTDQTRERPMKDANPKDAHRIFLEEGDLIDEALRQGVRDALLRHKERGQLVVIMRDGKIQWVPAEELLEGEASRVAERPDAPYGEKG